MSENRLNLILPAAGLGSRFRVVGELRPKPIIPVLDLPMIMWVLLNFPLLPHDKVWIISQTKDELPKALNQFVGQLPFEIEFVEIDGLTEGPASTVYLVLQDLDDEEPIIVANTDQYISGEVLPFFKMVREGIADGQILTMIASSNAWSYVGRDSNGRIRKVVEKEEISEEATVGVYAWTKASLAKLAFRHTFDTNMRTNNEFYVAPTYNFLIDQGYEVVSHMVGKHGEAVHGLGTPVDLRTFVELNLAQSLSKKFVSELENAR